MAKSRNQKGKILVLEHLLQGTGESRIVTMQEILDKLLEYGITAERKSIYDDIEALREFGLDVQYKRGRPGGYYLAGGQEIAAAPGSVHTKEEAGISKNAETEKKSEPVIIYKENTLDKEEIQNTEKAMKLQCDASREKEIREYADSEEPMDKAGAYAIQGLAAMFVIGLDGDYYNVMGLPVCPLAMILRKFGVKLLGC